MHRQALQKPKRIVVKVGSSVLISKDFGINKLWINDFCRQIVHLLKKDYEIVVVSSGAILSGMFLLNIKKRPNTLPEQQACAAVGQCYLMNIYESCFKKYSFHTAQILLTWEDIRERQRYLNAKNTLNTLLNKSVVPIVNENDTVSTDEIKFGDNDKLSALIAKIIGADVLVMLTDVKGLCIDGAEGRLIDTVEKIDSQIEKIALGTNKECSRGGMKTKIEAAKIMMGSGIYCVIANGSNKDVLLKIMKGENIGTLFVPRYVT